MISLVNVQKTKFHGIFKINGKLATINLVPGFRSSNEKLVKVNDREYRIWDFYTSKPSAAIKKKLKSFPIEKGSKILYLGLAEAKTASFFSDIVEKNGIVWGVEISERSLREAIPVCERRRNIVPILADARRPELYENIVFDKVDLVYCDVASPDEIELFIRNCEKFLKKKGHGMIAVKSRSIDVIKEPKIIYQETRKKLEDIFEILDFVILDPYEKDHGLFLLKLR